MMSFEQVIDIFGDYLALDTLIFRFHELRHTFATLAIQQGVDVKTVSNILGHYSAGFTLDTYAHVTGDMRREAADRMGGFIAQAI